MPCHALPAKSHFSFMQPLTNEPLLIGLQPASPDLGQGNGRILVPFNGKRGLNIAASNTNVSQHPIVMCQ